MAEQNGEIPAGPNVSPTTSDTTDDYETKKELKSDSRLLSKSQEKNSSRTSSTLLNDEGAVATVDEGIECAVCLQPCVHPVKLPCSHIFCYLCVKGVANRSKKCALCRTDIPIDFVNRPILVRKEDLLNSSALDDGTQWFYSGNNTGWWRYDPRTNRDIEEKFCEGIKKFEILIAGYLYVIDLEQMVQYRSNDSSRKRNIKRDQVSNVSTKGVAGLKLNEDDSVERESADGDGENDERRVPQPLPLPSDLRNNNRELLLRSAIMQISPAIDDSPQHHPHHQQHQQQHHQQRQHSSHTILSSSSGDNDSFIARMRDMQLGDNNPRYFIPRRGMGNSDSAMRRRRRRERESFSNIHRINTDSDESD